MNGSEKLLNLAQRAVICVFLLSVLSVAYGADNANDQNTHDAIDGPRDPFEDYNGRGNTGSNSIRVDQNLPVI